MSTQSPRTRGRPRGSVAPTHRFRRDYRFSQETLDTLAPGRARASDAANETAFVEQVIAHYAAFLEGSGQANQETAHLQAQIRDLESNLARTQQMLRLAKPQPSPLPRPGRRKPLYQILIKHDSGSCPSLPDDYGFLYTQEKEHHCPTRLVFSTSCPIDQARRRIEVLKRVPGLVRIWLTKDGYGVLLDDWSKGTSVWQRTN